MDRKISRRDFLKLAGLYSMAALPSGLLHYMLPARRAEAGKQNVLLVVFDALSASDISLHGYARETMPNLARLAERAIVYHHHYAGGNFSTPGTASLLTGVHPWTHRAFKVYGTVSEAFASRSLFGDFDDYFRIAYSHNPLVTTLLDQFAPNLDDYIPLAQLMLTSDGLIEQLFHKDLDISTVAWARTIKKEEYGYAYSLFLSELYGRYQAGKAAEYADLFPLGLPTILGDNYFLLEQAIDWLGIELGRIPRPFMGYFHFMPPHAPYNTRRDFHDHFAQDGLVTVEKPEDFYTEHHKPQVVTHRREQYDEFILYVDSEFGKLHDQLEASGLLEDTWLVLTSDHGEIFERGIIGHGTRLLYQPLIHIPLVIFEPGRKSRMDVHAATSAVDVLPTLLHVTGGRAPEFTEGSLLPPFASEAPDPGRSIYVMQAQKTEKSDPLTMASLSLIKGRYKLMYLFGYFDLNGKERIELYDIENDPEELNDLYSVEPEIGNTLLTELKARLAEKNRPYL